MDHYEFGKLLGQGSFGKVYNATDTRTGQNVVIKTIESYDPTSANEKISILKAISHHQVIKYIDSFYSNRGWLGIVMEFADKGTLEDLRPPLASQGYWDTLMSFIWNKDEIAQEYNVWRLLAQISEPLSYLHNQEPDPILHLDLKPANILFKEFWNRPKNRHERCIKIADYGTVSLLSKRAEESYFLRTCTTSPIYTAPEVLGSSEACAFTADIWSFRAIVYYFINREHLFDSKEEVLEWKKKSPLGDPYSSDLKDLVSKMLDPDTRGRPTAEEIYVATSKFHRQSKTPRKYLKI